MQTQTITLKPAWNRDESFTFHIDFKTWTLARDVIVVDQALQNLIDQEVHPDPRAPIPHTVQLFARKIEHAPGFVLRLTGRNIIIAATEYDAKGGAINVSGTPGTPGAAGG